MRSIQIHPGQAKVFNSRKKVVLAAAGFQSGKTTIVELAGVYRAEEEVRSWVQAGRDPMSKPRYAILVRREKDFKSVILPKFKELFPANKFVYSKSDMMLTLKPHGIEFRGYSVHNPDNIEGITVNGILMDEARLFDPIVWSKVLTRLAVRDGWALLATTPSTGWLKDRIYDVWRSGDPDYEVVQWRSIDNPGFSVKEYERLKSELPEEMFDMLYNGKFTSFSGLVYAYKPELHTLTTLPNRFDVVIGGIDYGFATPSAIVVIGINDGVYYVLKETVKKGIDDEKFADITLKYQDDYQVSVWYADPNAKDIIEKLRKAGVKVRRGINTVEAGISKVRSELTRGKLFVNVECEETIKEFTHYTYQMNDEGLYIDKVFKKNDHAMDAIRYAMYTHYYTPTVDLSRQIILDLKNKSNAAWTAYSNNFGTLDHLRAIRTYEQGLNDRENSWNYD
jgi:phage terminase large subunit